MSKIIWYILGVLTILASVLLFSGIPERLAVLPPDQHPKLIAGYVFFAGVLGTIIAICFFPRVNPVTLRIMGMIGIAGCVFNLREALHTKNFSQLPITLAFWLPGSIYLVVKGKLN